MTTPAIHPSACGRYIVSMFGAYPHVIPIEEARGVRELYLEHASRLSAEGKTAAANMEMTVASMLTRAVDEADGFRAELVRREERKASRNG